MLPDSDHKNLVDKNPVLFLVCFLHDPSLLWQDGSWHVRKGNTWQSSLRRFLQSVSTENDYNALMMDLWMTYE
jgi:hypothetical protein